MRTRDLGITFAGGGTSAFYQLGFMRRWRDSLLPRVAVISAVSAGACVAAILLSGREDEVSELWQARSRAVKKNFDWRRLLAGQRPTPHQEIYRDLLLHAFADGGFERIRSRPFPVFVLTTAFPRFLPAMAAALVGGGAYVLEGLLRKQTVHQTFGRRIGFRGVTFDARDCRTPRELADLILASSATPPFTSIGAFSGRRLLDGGIIDSAPVFQAEDFQAEVFQTEGFQAETLPDEVRQLILLSRHRPADLLGKRGSRLYLAPTQPLPLKTWDYTRPETLFDIVALGEQDADFYRSLVTAFLNSSVPSI